MSGHVVICGTRPANLMWAATCQYLRRGTGDAILIHKRSVGKLDPPQADSFAYEQGRPSSSSPIFATTDPSRAGRIRWREIRCSTYYLHAELLLR